jgi:hypothetical protein
MSRLGSFTGTLGMRIRMRSRVAVRRRMGQELHGRSGRRGPRSGQFWRHSWWRFSRCSSWLPPRSWPTPSLQRHRSPGCRLPHRAGPARNPPRCPDPGRRHRRTVRRVCPATFPSAGTEACRTTAIQQPLSSMLRQSRPRPRRPARRADQQIQEPVAGPTPQRNRPTGQPAARKPTEPPDGGSPPIRSTANHGRGECCGGRPFNSVRTWELCTGDRPRCVDMLGPQRFSRHSATCGWARETPDEGLDSIA